MKVVTKVTMQFEVIEDVGNETLEEIEKENGFPIGSLEHGKRIEEFMKEMFEEDGLKVRHMKALSFSSYEVEE